MPKLPPGQLPVDAFYKVGTSVIPVSQVRLLDFSKIEQLEVAVHLVNGLALVASDLDAMELAMRTKPSVLEGKRLRWPRFLWVVHNLIAHPLMQVLALCRLYKWAFWVHDATVPRPTGAKARGRAANPGGHAEPTTTTASNSNP